MAVCHLVEDAAEGPDVARSAEFHETGLADQGHWLPRGGIDVDDCFGAHVVQGADLTFTVDVDGVVLNRVGNAEVDQLQLAADEEKVGGFQVGVDNVVLMDDVNALKHLTPVISDKTDVKLRVLVAITQCEDVGKVSFAAFHKL